MCGITGFFNFPELMNEKQINNLLTIIKNRGPDNNNHKIIENNLLFIFTRLSIVDLSDQGLQPMTSKSGKYTILFNGEIYNHKKIRKDLETKKVSFQGHSDTEVLIESIDQNGLSILKYINGMYSFALFDHTNSYLYLVNDRFGEKPLYYFHNDKKIFFSSDIKSFNFQKRTIDKKSLSSYFNNYVISYPDTIWKDVKRIEPSQIIKFKIDLKEKKIELIETKSYWSNKKNFYFKIRDSLDTAADKLDSLLNTTIENQLNNDVMTGTFLSGGIDSTLVTSIASKIKKNLKTISVGFKDPKLDESIYATKIADHLNTDHYNKILDADDVTDIVKIIPDVYGEPFADSSQIPTLLLCKYAVSKVKVCLTGDAGDELFGGYERYSFVPKFWNVAKYFPESVRTIIKKIFEKTAPYSYKTTRFIIQNIFFKYRNTVYFEIKLRNLLLSLNSKNPIEFAKKLSFHFHDDYNLIKEKISSDRVYNFDKQRTLINNLMLDDVNDYLPNDLLVKVDRASMYYGLETRIPFLNHEIYEFSQQIPDSYKIKKSSSKVILKKILERYVPKKLFDRPKHGFLAPIKDIILREKEFIHSILDPELIKKQNILDHNIVKKELDDYESFGFNQYNLWDIIVFQLWVNNNYSYIDN